MIRTLRSAYVIGRRDFTATVMSKAFIFFLIGPLFPVLLGIMFGGIGARVAVQANEVRLAVIAEEADFARFAKARSEVVEALSPRAAPVLLHVEPQGDPDRQAIGLLRSDGGLAGVLTGGTARPRLAGAIEADGELAGQVELLARLARAPADTGSGIEIRTVERAASAPGLSTAITAQTGQMILFFLTIILAGMTLSQLIEEKSNKVIEILAAAVPIESIFLGKLFAMLAASIVGIAVWVSAGVLAVSLLVEGGTGAIPPPSVGPVVFILLTTLYFAMNYLLLGSIFLSIGAQAASAREVQVLSMPVTVAQVLIFGLASFAVGAPDSAIAIAGAIFPLSSPLVMVARAAERPDIWPHVVAFAWQALWIGLIVLVSARLFRRTVLKSGPARRRWWKRASA